jgi:predicted deacylase
VLNLPAFRARTPFVCPIDNMNPNRVFPGDPRGSYSEQMTHALINEFVFHADAYVDLHGGDIPEALVPFVICRSEAGLADFKPRDVAARSKEIAMAFGLPYVLTVSKPVQPSKGQSSYAAAADKGIPAVLAEAGGIGQMQEGAVALLSRGVINVMRHLEMIESVADATAKANDEARMTNDETNPKSKIQNIAGSNMATTLLTNFEWLYTKSTGVWYPKVAPGDAVRDGERIGTVGDLFGDTLEEIVSPVNGVVLFLTINPSVLENGLLMGIGAE